MPYCIGRLHTNRRLQLPSTDCVAESPGLRRDGAHGLRRHEDLLGDVVGSDYRVRVLYSSFHELQDLVPSSFATSRSPAPEQTGTRSIVRPSFSAKAARCSTDMRGLGRRQTLACAKRSPPTRPPAALRRTPAERSLDGDAIPTNRGRV